MRTSSRKLLASAVASAPAPPLAPQHHEKTFSVDAAYIVYIYVVLTVMLLLACSKGRRGQPTTRRDPAGDGGPVGVGEAEEEDEIVPRNLQVGAPPASGHAWMLGNAFTAAAAAAARSAHLKAETGAAQERARRYLEAMPVLVHVAAAVAAAAAEEGGCSICLGEFKDGEELRVLEKCKHKYHKNCVDPWLILHGKCCPLCREVAIPT